MPLSGVCIYWEQAGGCDLWWGVACASIHQASALDVFTIFLNIGHSPSVLSLIMHPKHRDQPVTATDRVNNFPTIDLDVCPSETQFINHTVP
jgi:hypothetical protein